MSLLVRFTKRADGSVVLRCERVDGSATWQRQDGRHAGFFPFHDLTHFAVETTLGFQQGFYGLLAGGWEIADTGGKGSRGRLPDEAVLVEHVVGLFDHERVGGAPPLAAAEFNSQLQKFVADGRLPRAPTFSEAQLAAVRARIEALHNDWAALAMGETLTLAFEPAAPAP
jgi:hypothetical protein